MTNVRNVKNEKDCQDEEYFQFCQECDRPLSIIPPESDNDDCIYDWLDKHYFYCSKCQEDFGHSEIVNSE